MDFFCPGLDLAVEIDGESHNYNGEQEISRENRLKALGIEFVRFPERYVIENTEEVIRYLTDWIVRHRLPA